MGREDRKSDIVWHISLEEVEKYRAKPEEKQKQDKPAEPPSPELDKRGLRRHALVTHILIVVSIFIFCVDEEGRDHDLFDKIFDNPGTFFLFAATAVSGFLLFLRAWSMLEQGWGLNYPAYLKPLPVIAPVIVFLSFALLVVAAATDAGMFRLGFLLIYWIPGGIFLVHFINSLEKKS